MLRVEDVAVRWGLNVKTVYAMIERGELVARRFGRVLRIPRAVVESIEQASVAPEEGEHAGKT
jgi:excisionase family DNA binding protein